MDSNHATDVYEYENGAVSLVSAGTGAYESALATATESGHDLFFTTSDQLVPRDEDELIDMYDARVGGGFPEAFGGPPPCAEVESCRSTGQGSTTGSTTPASAVLQGSGNLVPAPIVAPKKKTAAQIRAEHLRSALKLCKAKRNKHRRAVCEATARHKYGTLKTGKSGKGTKKK